MKHRFNLQRRPGRAIAPPAGSGATYAHEHVAADGTVVVVLRDSRGKVMRGSPLHSLREGSGGREPTRPDSVARAALGIDSAVMERQRRRGGKR